MKKSLLALATLAVPALLSAQSAMDAYQFAQPDLKGTARFMSMGGAFGALGGDLSTLSQNPGGIGVYRQNEIGFTLDLDAQQSKATSQGLSTKWDRTPFYLNNIGCVFSIRNSGALRNVNLGFTYNKTSSFNRRFRGTVPQLGTSVTNYIAGLANGSGVNIGDVSSSGSFDPYNPTDGGLQAPWATIIGYDSYFINARQADGKAHWDGQFGEGTTGSGYFRVIDKGAMDEYNIAIGGNVSNIFYWGMDFGIVDFSYERNSLWGEKMDNAWVSPGGDAEPEQTTSDIQLQSRYKVTGTGFNYKLGFIVRPVSQLRIGLAMHTPTWYDLEQSYIGATSSIYGNHRGEEIHYTNGGYDAVYDYRFRTPWRLIASMAGVIANRFIISADYEWANYRYCHFTDKYEDDWLDAGYETYRYTNEDIRNMYQSTSTLRVGAEARVSNSVSLRAGYSLMRAPVKSEVFDNKEEVFTDGARLDYTLDDRTYYITGGIGFHHKGFYTDLAYVYKNRRSEYHPFPTDIADPQACPSARVTSANHQVVLSMGFKF